MVFKLNVTENRIISDLDKMIRDGSNPFIFLSSGFKYQIKEDYTFRIVNDFIEIINKKNPEEIYALFKLSVIIGVGRE